MNNKFHNSGGRVMYSTDPLQRGGVIDKEMSKTSHFRGKSQKESDREQLRDCRLEGNLKHKINQRSK